MSSTISNLVDQPNTKSEIGHIHIGRNEIKLE